MTKEKTLGYFDLEKGGQIQIVKKEFKEIYYRISHPQYDINKIYKRTTSCTNSGEFIPTQLGRVYLDLINWI